MTKTSSPVPHETVIASGKKSLKRIDMGFLSMRLPNGLPRFACLPYSSYSRGDLSWICQFFHEDNRTPITDITLNLAPGATFRKQWSRYNDENGHMVQGEVFVNLPCGPSNERTKYYTAEPSSKVPEAVQAAIPGWEKEGYEDLRVAWEATWKEALVARVAPSDNPLDPILIGYKGGKHYILAVWDLTKLESYVCQEFSEDGE